MSPPPLFPAKPEILVTFEVLNLDGGAPMAYEELIAQISQAHGSTEYHAASEGVTHCFELSDSQHRDATFQIYNHAAHGVRRSLESRATQATRFNFQVRTPNGNTLKWKSSGVDPVPVAPERIYPGGKVAVVRDSTGLALVEVTHAALFLLFDIEQVEHGEDLLRQIYETWVLPLTSSREDQKLVALSS